jgi:hypothetical protein
VPLFVKRVSQGPATLDELEAQRAEQRKAREKAEHERLKQLERTPKTPVLATELLDVEPSSLREAAYLIERKGGEIRAKGDELVIELPERARHRAELLPACRLLFASRETVLAALRSKKGVDGLPAAPSRGGEA